MEVKETQKTKSFLFDWVHVDIENAPTQKNNEKENETFEKKENFGFFPGVH